MQVSVSDSRISFRLYSHTNESLSRYVHVLQPSSLIPILSCFYISQQCEVSPVEVSNVRHSSYSRTRMFATALSKGSRLSKRHFRFASGGFTRLLQASNVPRSCRQQHHQPKRYLDKTKPSASTRTKRQFQAAVTPLPRGDDAPHAVLTPLPRPDDNLTPVPRPSHAAVTRLPRHIAVAMTLLPRSADAPPTPR